MGRWDDGKKRRLEVSVDFGRVDIEVHVNITNQVWYLDLTDFLVMIFCCCVFLGGFFRTSTLSGHFSRIRLDLVDRVSPPQVLLQVVF